MATTSWWAVAQAVRSRWAGLPGYRLPGVPGDGTTVYLLTEAATEDERGDLVVVAWPGDPDRETSPGGSEQVTGPQAASAGRGRDETGTVQVRVIAHSGDTDPATAMTRAMSVVADLETLARADPTFAVAGYARMVVQVRSMSVHPVLNRGAGVEVDVELGYTARI
jgi:hypothetical protein